MSDSVPTTKPSRSPFVATAIGLVALLAVVIAAAQRRLEASLAWARAHGFTATGSIGSDDPETAMADALRRSGAEAVVIVHDGEDGATRLEQRAFRRADAELAIPVVHVHV